MRLKVWEIILLTFLAFVIIVCIILYFCLFNGQLSENSADWGNFGSYISGTIVPLLTIINIWLFYKLTVAVENNTNKRSVKSKVTEAQVLITNMRVRQYEELRRLVNDAKPDLYNGRYNATKIHEIKKRLMEVDSSFLYKTNNLEDESFLFPQAKKICDIISAIDSHIYTEKRYTKEETDNLAIHLSEYISLMEIYILSQIIREPETQNYITKHRSDLDSTLCCIDKFCEMTVHKMAESKE